MTDNATQQNVAPAENAAPAVDASVATNGFKSSEDFAKWAFGGTPEPKQEAPAEESKIETKPEEPVKSEAPATPAASESTETPKAEAPKPEEPVALPFSAVNEKGEAVDPSLLAGLKITLKANGKEHQLPLQNVVRLAQSEAGAQQTLKVRERERDDWQRKAEEALTEAEELRTIGLRLLSDPEFLKQSLEEYDQFNTPESRAERAERELAATRRNEQAVRSEQVRAETAVAFFENDAAPLLASILQENPEVSEYEILGRMHADTASLSVNGVVPPENYGAFKSYLAVELRDFAKSLNAGRVAAKSESKRVEEEARRKSQEAKNEMADALRPSGEGLSGGVNAPSRPKIKTVNDAAQFALAAFA